MPHARRRGPRFWLVSAIFVAYVGVVLYGTLGPEPGDQVREVAESTKAVEQDVAVALAGERRSGGAPSGWFEGVGAEDVGNILMFLPFGFLLPELAPRVGWWAVILGCALSGATELTQLLALPHRSAEWRDVALNSLGALIGYVSWALGGAMLRRLRGLRNPG